MTNADQPTAGDPSAHGGAPIPPRDAAVWVAARLAKAGYRALFAGGCVRDGLLGMDPVDYDVATSATPEQIRAVFPRAIGVGESFGVMLVRHGGRSIEVATFRADGPYDDGRRPVEVRFTDDREDAQRRDFTINGLFEDPSTGDIIDYVGGQADLAARRLRAIGDARERFNEDRLRTLRAVRFAARFDLEIEPDTLDAIRSFARDLGAVSRERIGHEVRRMLAHASRARAVTLCEQLGLASVMLMESHMPWHSTLLQGLPAGAAVPTSLAAWMLGRGGAGDMDGAADGARLAGWRRALLLSNEETDAMADALRVRARTLESWAAGDAAARKRLASNAAFGPALQLIRAGDRNRAESIERDTATLAQTGLAPAPFVTGDDLVRAGLAPGPTFRGILDRLYDRQLNGEICTRQQALEEVARLSGTR